MKCAAAFILALLPAALAHAQFAAPPHITAVATSRTFGENRTDIAYRATVKDLRGQEGGTRLIIEKIQMSYEPFLEPTLLWQEEWTLDDLGRAPRDAFNKLRYQAQLNCCDYIDLGWNDKVLHFLLVISERKKFHCKIPVETGAPALCTPTR